MKGCWRGSRSMNWLKTWSWSPLYPKNGVAAPIRTRFTRRWRMKNLEKRRARRSIASGAAAPSLPGMASGPRLARREGDLHALRAELPAASRIGHRNPGERRRLATAELGPALPLVVGAQHEPLLADRVEARPAPPGDAREPVEEARPLRLEPAPARILRREHLAPVPHGDPDLVAPRDRIQGSRGLGPGRGPRRGPPRP